MTPPREAGTGRRATSRERLDADHLDPAALAASLAQVDRVNRWFGGSRALRIHLEPLLAREGGARILDVGTGNGRTLAELLAWAGARGRSWVGVGIDRHPQVCRVAGRAIAANGSVRVVHADGLKLPFADDSFDASLCTLTLHHLGDEEARVLLSEMARVSRGLVVVNDLHRHPINHFLALLLSWTLWLGDPITRHDGPLSVLRSFTPDELASLATAAGLDQPRVSRHPVYRIVLTCGAVPDGGQPEVA